MSPIGVLKEAGERGLTLKAVGENLHVIPANRCPPDFAEKLRAHKKHLLVLLHLPFVMVYSAPLLETIFFALDEDTKAALIEAGADPASVYTREELCSLVEQHKRAPITVADLVRIHEAKRIFSARISC